MRPDPIVNPKRLTVPSKGAAKPISKTFDWATVTLDPDKATVLVTQKWKYSWDKDPEFKPWTHAEKKAFHEKAETLIWTAWNRKAVAKAKSGANASPESKSLVDRLSGRDVAIHFDIQWVTEAAQWQVIVKKEGRTRRFDPTRNVKRPMLPRANVNWGTRIAHFFLSDLDPGVARDPETHKNFNQNYVIPAHEFGHFLQNRDEYGDSRKQNAEDKEDLESIMSIGNKLRSRHFESIKKALDEMVPGCSFAVFVK